MTKAYFQDDHVTLFHGEALQVLRTLPSESVDCVVTSPPYFGLRDYGVAGHIGVESSPAEYVSALVGVFKEVHRVLSATGTLWLNLGDSYATATCGGTQGEAGRGRLAGSLLRGSPLAGTSHRRTCLGSRGALPSPFRTLVGSCATTSFGPSQTGCPNRLAIGSAPDMSMCSSSPSPVTTTSTSTRSRSKAPGRPQVTGRTPLPSDQSTLAVTATEPDGEPAVTPDPRWPRSTRPATPATCGPSQPSRSPRPTSQHLPSRSRAKRSLQDASLRESCSTHSAGQAPPAWRPPSSPAATSAGELNRDYLDMSLRTRLSQPTLTSEAHRLAEALG